MMPTKQRPAKTQSSRRFGAESEKKSNERRLEPDFPADSDQSFPRPKISRSTSYTTPLSLLVDRSDISRSSAPLTRENLHSFLSGLEKQKSAPPTASTYSSGVEDPGHMRKTKSPKKSDKKKSNLDPNSHPLNLPPEELRRLSAAMAREEARNSTPMDVDNDDPVTNGTSEPPSPSKEAPGAFPDTDANGLSDREEKSPTPPPHRTPTPQVDPEACKAAGNKFFKAKDYDRAVQEYTKAVDAEPSNPTYLSNRAAAYMSANKFNLALSDSVQANRLDSSDKNLHRLARIYTSLGRPQDALDTYARISTNPSTTDTAAARKALQSIEIAEKQIDSDDGNGNMALWSIDQAKQTLGAATPMPRNWQILRAKANIKIGSINSLGEVQGITQGLMRENSNDTDAIVLAGQSCYLKDDKPRAGKTDYERAEMYFRQALSLDPDNASARTWLRTMKKLERARNEANDFFKRGRYPDAVTHYTDALEIDATNKITNAKLLGNRAMARMKTKDYELAREDCDKALKLDPTYTKAKRTRAKATGEGGDWEQAVKDLKALAEESPGDNDLTKELRNAEIELKKSKQKDYYKILGVDKDAGDKDIERAYKKKAAVLHPDKTQGDKEKEAMFKDCLEAKEILTDPQKRQMFDQGIDPNDPSSGMGGGGFPGGMGGMGGMGGGGMQIDPEILMQMFGGMGGGGPGGGRGGGGGMPHFQFNTGGGGMGGGGRSPFG